VSLRSVIEECQLGNKLNHIEGLFDRVDGLACDFMYMAYPTELTVTLTRKDQYVTFGLATKDWKQDVSLSVHSIMSDVRLPKLRAHVASLIEVRESLYNPAINLKLQIKGGENK